MLFSSLIFLYVFFPACLLLYFLCRNLKAKNGVLLIASLLFYAWGEPVYLLLMVAVAGANWAFGRLLGKRPERKFLTLAVTFNLLCLGVFKYTGFVLENVYALAHIERAAPQIALPIGISFYTFQAMSYVIDVYRGQVGVQRSFAKFLLYVSLFPQLIAGPIVRYSDVEKEIEARKSTPKGCFYGMTRFCIGLAKKVLIADYAGAVADQLLGGSFTASTTLGLWFGVLMYMFQIYFDFSGYSDMAIGMGRIFGFKYPENFRYPYVSKTITEFWRRWHISLSSFFRDYVYIPLGGSRCSRARQVLNLFAVWSLTGIWHGANWTFLAWGLWFFVLLTAEKLWLGKALSRLPRVFGHVYALLAVLIGWIFFNSRSLPDALGFLRALVVPGTGAPDGGAWLLLCLKQYGLQLAVCFVLCTDLGKKLWQTLGGARAGRALRYAVLALVFFLSVLTLTGSGMQAFIYARF
mgnify:CR=1 FL=1